MKSIWDNPDESQIIKPKRVFKCKPCERFATRKDVIKRRGKYFCVICDGEVQDVTDTVTGQNLIQIVGL